MLRDDCHSHLDCRYYTAAIAFAIYGFFEAKGWGK